MANFVTNIQWDINNVDTSVYTQDNIQDFSDEQNSNLTFNGTVYPDHLFIDAESGATHRNLNGYGNYTLNLLLPNLSTGTFGAVEEFDVNTGTTRWYLDQLNISASSVANAALNGTFTALIQNAFSGNDTITLSAFADVMNGFGGNDTMKGAAGNDTMDGGSGSDTAVFDSSFAQATISFSGTVLTITTAAEGTDTLTNFEFVSFNGDVRSVASLNDPPVPSAKTDTATEDGAIVNGQLSATDPEGSSLTFSATAPTIAGLTINSNGSYSFNPGNSAYQSLKQGQTAELQAGYSVFDGFHTANSTLTITITGVNDAPVFQTGTMQFDAGINTATNFSAAASDIDGDTVTYVATDPAHGTISGGTNGQFTYTPDTGYTGADSVTVTASDGNGGSVMRTYSISVSAANSAPVFLPTVLEFSATLNTSTSFATAASDADGDTLTYTAADPAHGTVTGGANGQFTYTPDTGYVGTDSVTVTVSDGKGGSAMQTYVVTVQEVPSPTDWTLLTSTGFTGSVGGAGRVFGTGNFEDITVLDLSGIVVFDGSFNKGNDIVRLKGNASDWEVVQSGSFAVFNDGDTYVSLPAGAAGQAVVFDDGVLTLRFDTTEQTLKIGTQAFAGSTVQVNASPGSATLPTGADSDATASLLFKPSGSATASGNINVFGTTSGETLTMLSGDFSLDGSFNKGGDTLVFEQSATTFMASRVGSALFLDGPDLDVLIPFGTIGIDLQFTGGDERTMTFDTTLGAILVDGQQIGIDAVALAAA